MISDVQTATKIKELLLSISHQLEGSLEEVKRTCTADESRDYQTAVGRVIGKMLFEIIEPLYEKNPSLKPDGWDE